MSKAKVYIVDDDTAVREAIQFLLSSRDLETVGFDSAEAFLEAFGHDLRGCLLTDVRMTGMSGLELFLRLSAEGSRLPCILLTGHGDVPMAVTALQAGVRDFVEKPFDGHQLVDKILATMAFDEQQYATYSAQESLKRRLSTLTSREEKVMRLLLAGKQNKIIADDLGISIRTVEVHRSRVFEKIGVKSAVDLAVMLSNLE